MAIKRRTRKKVATKASGGGKAAFVGPRYQAEVAGFFSVHMLAERAAVPVWDLPADTTVESVRCETDEAIDDVLLRLANGGFLYLQAKRTASLSDAAGSPLRSAMDQFTRQYLHARDRSGVGVWDRPLDSRDRFVLVTRSTSGSPLCVIAAEVLDRLRELDPTQSVSAAARTKEEKRALRILIGHVKASWKGATGAAPAADEVRDVLRYVHIETLDTEPAGEHAREARKRLRDDVLRDPTQDDVSWKLITHAAETASGGQSGLARPSLEALLTDAKIALRSVRSYNGDIAQIGVRSERSRRILEEFATLRVAGESVHVPRIAIDALATAAEAASLLVIGEPGAGKSGALHDLYIRTRDAGRPVILLVADDVNAPSITALQTDLGLEHEFIDVLRNWRNAEPGTIIIDALDSLRSNGTGTTLRRVIAMVQQEKLNWRVVASIRTFDLRRGAELQKLFRGAPPYAVPESFRDAEFTGFRHIRIPRLTDDELAYVSSAVPTMGAIIASAPSRLYDLLRVPFNLSLLAQLLDAGTVAGDLATIATQLDLLDLYWNRRVIDDDGRHAREVALRRIAERMIEKRQLRLPRASAVDASEAAAVEELLRRHVLAEPLDEQGQSEGTEIAFAHHVLFDYATARLVCRVPAADFATLLTNRSLPLVIWPSLMMHFHHEWGRSTSRTPFWSVVFAVVDRTGVPALARVIGPMAAAELATSITDLQPILDALKGSDVAKRDTAAKVLQFVVTAVHAGSRPFLGPEAGPWAALAAAAAPDAGASVMYPVANLLREANEQHAALSTEELANYGIAARALLAFAWSGDQHRSLVRLAIVAVARTYESDVAASRALLQRVLEPSRLRNVGYEELPRLAHEVPRLVAIDPSFVTEVYRSAFSFEDESKDATSIGRSALLALTSNRRQDYHGAWFELSRSYPKFLAARPSDATRALIHAVEGYEDRRARYGDVDEVSFAVGDKTAHVRTDGSAIWDTDSIRDDVRSMLAAFEAAVAGYAAAENIGVLREMFDVLVEQNRYAALWRRLLQAARTQPAALKEFVLPMLTEPAVLLAHDMHRPAQMALPTLVPHFTEYERKAVEHAILGMSIVPAGEDEEYATELRNRLARAIPRDLIATDEMRALRQTLDGPTTTAADDTDDSLPLGWRGRLADREAELQPPDVRAVLGPLEEIRTLYLNDPPPTDDLARIVSAIDAGTAFRASHPHLEPEHGRLIDVAVAGAAAIVVRNKALQPGDAAFVRARELLLAAAVSPDPELNSESEKKWDTEHPSFSHGVRIHAAEGLITLAFRAAAAQDKEVLAMLERLSQDPVASVRMNIIRDAQVLGKDAPELAWRILDRVREEEPRFAVAVVSLHPLRWLSRADAARSVGHAITILRRYSTPTAPELIAREVTYFLTGRYLYADDPDARAWLAETLGAADVDPEISASAVHGIRDALTTDDESEVHAAGVRNRAFQVARDALAASARIYRAAVSRPDFLATPLPEEELKRLQRHAHVIESVALEAQFACGTSLDEEREVTTEAKAKRQRIVQRFFVESTALVDDIIAVGHVPASHHILEMLTAFIDLDPRGTFLRIVALLRHASENGYQQEHEAMRLMVTIVERYLADYRDLLEGDAECRDGVVEILNMFIEAGWPDALRLAFRLGDLFR